MDNEVLEFIGIYDADSTLWGEISYWIGARLGRTHCSLCEITHGLLTRKKQWKECANELSILFETFHRNDAPADVLEFVRGQFPIVIARTTTSFTVVATPEKLAEMNGSPQQLADLLESFH